MLIADFFQIIVELEIEVCTIDDIQHLDSAVIGPLILHTFSQVMSPIFFSMVEFTNRQLEKEQGKFLDKKAVKEYKSFVSRNLHILARYVFYNFPHSM